MATHATTWFGVLSQSAGTLSPGTAVVLDANDEFVVATSANRALYGRSRGVALSAADASVRSFEYQVAGVLSAELSGIATGSSGDWVIVNASGALERDATPDAGEDVIGRCPHTSGDVQLAPGVWDSDNYAGGGGGGGGGDASYPIDLTDGAEVDVPAAGLISSDGTALASVTTSAGIAALISDETGTGKLVFGTSPTFLTSTSYGASPSTFGEHRYTNNEFLWWRGGGTNYQVLGLNADDEIVLGDTAPIFITAGFGDAITMTAQELYLSVNKIILGDDVDVDPCVTTGTGAPSSSPPDGSIFLRTDGTAATGIYTRQGGAWSAIGGDSLDIAGVCTLEQFGAVGDGVTDDSAAWDAAATALNAGTYGALILGAKAYLVGSADFSFGFAIVGQGPASVLKTTADLPIIRMYDGDAGDRAKTTLLRDFALLGNSTGTYQYGVESGTFGNDGSSRLRLIGVEARSMGGAGFAWAQGPTTGIGPQIENCRAISCLYGFYAGDQANLVGCQAASCGTGIYVQAGNVNWTGGDITGSTTKTVHIDANANDGHGQFTSCNFNHNPGAAVYIEAIANGHTFNSCHFYETPLTIDACTGLVQFTNCVLDVTTYTMSGRVKFDSCRFDSDYFAAYNDSGTPDVEFLNCRSISGELPSFIYDRTQLHYTFPSDANQTLTAQQSRAEIIVIQDGVTTAMRTITSALPPTKGRKLQIINLHATQNVQFKWSSGVGLNVGIAGTGMIIGADGTNALQLGTP